MKSVSLNPIKNLWLAAGAASSLTALVVAMLAATSGPAQARIAPTQLGRPLAPRALITSTSTLTGDGPTTVLELFETASPPPARLAGAAALDTAGNNLSAMAVSIPLLSSSPIFTSNQTPADTGTYGLDWGDVDRDGDLDLAIASVNGTAVFLNNGNGSFTQISNTFPTFDVRWANVDAEPNLELIAVGYGASAFSNGFNFVFISPETTLFSYYLFGNFADPQIFRAAPGDYDGDGDIDVAVSTLDLNPPCPVQLYLNDGVGNPFDTPFSCISATAATASLDAADFDNDGDLDLALSSIQTQEFLVRRNNGTGNFGSTVTVASGLTFPANDAAWGDYNKDGSLDLALAFSIQQETRIYSNTNGSGFAAALSLPSNLFLTPMAVDWADFNGDGLLDLAAAELPPKVYDGASNFSSLLAQISSGAVPATARIRNLRGIDVDNDIDLDLSLSNQFGPNLIFETTAPPLSPRLTAVAPGPAGSVAWGETTDSGYLDLLFGDTLYQYDNATGVFANPVVIHAGAVNAAFGGIITTGTRLDVLSGDATQYSIYQGTGSGTFSGPAWTVSSAAGTKSLAWGLLNNDPRLELLLGNNNSDAILAFYNSPSAPLPPSTSPAWSSAEQETTYQVAWADFTGSDGYLDFAAANGNAGVRLYRNNIDTSFSLVQTLSAPDARSLDWADYDGDGDLDLAVGNYNSANQVYQNQGGTLTLAWSTPAAGSNTTAVAWGDWDADGDFDLAVGNENQRDQVYANLGSPGSPNLQLLWESQEISPTTGLAWGDKDGDGDLDLAVSQGAGGQNGLYENNSSWPAHLNNATQYMPLPRNSSYISIARPGTVPDAYFYSSPELLGYLAAYPNVTIPFTLFDPDGPRNQASPAGDNIAAIEYEYSLDGGGTWTLDGQQGALATNRAGNALTYVWNAGADNAISDNARFRMTITYQKPTGPVQRASIRAISPPFRVRAVNCNWPANPTITIVSPPPYHAQEDLIQFLGLLESGTGSGALSFIWDFGDGITKTAQFVNHRYNTAGTYPVVLKVSGGDCPSSQTVGIRTTITVEPPASSSSLGSPAAGSPFDLYLPLILKSGDQNSPTAPVDETLTQVTGLRGTVEAGGPGVRLEWGPGPNDQTILGYRIYRASSAAPGATFQLLATTPANVNSYVDQTATCSQMYYVTVFSAEGESDASDTSYFSPPCPPVIGN